MNDNELKAKIVKKVKNSPWRDIKEMGVNMQQAMKIRKGEDVKFYPKTLERLRPKFEK